MSLLLNPYRFTTAPWTPALLPNLALWLDASDAATITDAGGGLCSAWNDKSGNANHASSPGGLRPTIGVDSTSGLGKLVFASKYMTVASSASLTSPTNGVTVMTACNITSWANFSNFLLKDVAAWNTPGWRIINNSGTTQAGVQTSGGLKNANYASTPTGRQRIGFRVGTTSNNLISRRNGATTNTTASTGTYTTTSSPILISADTAGTGNVNQDLFEIVVCMADISDTDLGLLETYLATKWSV